MQFDFLLCSERSGSNLITSILDSHPQVCAPFPSHVIRHFAYNLHRYGDLGHDSNWSVLLADVEYYMGSIFSEWATCISADELRLRARRRTLGEIGRIIYQKEAMAQGKSRVFVKENHAHSFVAVLLEGFDLPSFLFLVRDPRDMAATWKQLARRSSVVNAATTWKSDQVGSIRVYSALQSSGRSLLVRFEDLLASPEATVRKVCDFLKIPFVSEMLEFYLRPSAARNASRMRSWEDLTTPIQSNNSGFFPRELSEIEIQYVEALCSEEMDFFGYERVLPPATECLQSLREKLTREPVVDRKFTKRELEAYARHDQAVARLAERALYRERPHPRS